MKKLMIAAAVVCAAALAQAANVSWGFGGKMYLSTDGNVATLSKSADADTKAAFSGYNLALVLLESATYDVSKIKDSQVVDSIAWGYNSSSGKWNPATQAKALDSTMEGKYFAIVLDTGAGYDNLYAVNTGTGAVGDAVDGTYQITADHISGKTALTIYGMGAAATAGAITAVPEPTSAMLLLLGMAGLALRRRRA